MGPVIQEPLRFYFLYSFFGPWYSFVFLLWFLASWFLILGSWILIPVLGSFIKKSPALVIKLNSPPQQKQ